MIQLVVVCDSAIQIVVDMFMVLDYDVSTLPNSATHARTWLDIIQESQVQRLEGVTPAIRMSGRSQTLEDYDQECGRAALRGLWAALAQEQDEQG